MARRVLADGYIPLLLRYLRCGAPVGLRAQLWARALGMNPGGGGAHYEALVEEVGRVAQARRGGWALGYLSHSTRFPPLPSCMPPRAPCDLVFSTPRPTLSHHPPPP
jgi:hypothetical protein